jgi:hypothetical protein
LPEPALYPRIIAEGEVEAGPPPHLQVQPFLGQPVLSREQ